MNDDKLVSLSPEPEPPGTDALEFACADGACVIPLAPHDKSPISDRDLTPT